MKKHWKTIALATLAVVLVLAVSGAVLAGGPGWKSGAKNDEASTQGVCDGESCENASLLPLSDAEEEALLFLREEEKLARDVYAALYDKWGTAVFDNIAASESRHMASVKTLLDRYGLTDPVAADTPGVFANAELQAAYYDLLAQGSRSLEEALKVGQAIEELDIEDLEELLAISDEHPDVTRVARNLLRGSENHLAAFTRLL